MHSQRAASQQRALKPYLMVKVRGFIGVWAWDVKEVFMASELKEDRVSGRKIDRTANGRLTGAFGRGSLTTLIGTA